MADLYETSVCPLAKVMRRELKKREIKSLKVVYSKEVPVNPQRISADEETEFMENTGKNQMPDLKISGDGEFISAARRSTPGSVAFVPSVAGLIIAGEVIKDLTTAVR